MTFQKDDRIRLVGEELPEGFEGATGTVIGTMEEWIHERYGEDSYYGFLVDIVDVVIRLDYTERELALEERSVQLLEEDPEVQELEALLNAGD